MEQGGMITRRDPRGRDASCEATVDTQVVTNQKVSFLFGEGRARKLYMKDEGLKQSC